MKYREKLGYITLGGVLMLVGMLTAGLFSPLGAQSQSDGYFDKITCRRLEVVTRSGAKFLEILTQQDGGNLALYHNGEKKRVSISVPENGASLALYSENTGALIQVVNDGGHFDLIDSNSQATMEAALGEAVIHLRDKDGNTRYFATP